MSKTNKILEKISVLKSKIIKLPFSNGIMINEKNYKPNLTQK